MINSAVEPHRTYFEQAQQAMEEMRPSAPPMVYPLMNNTCVLLLSKHYYASRYLWYAGWIIAE